MARRGVRHRSESRPAALAALLLVLAQSALGMVVNLDVTVPARHSGSSASNYLTGSIDSVGWAIGHGAAALVAHAVLGLALALVALLDLRRAVRAGSRTILALWTLAALLVVGAGFNGASFLDYGRDASSLVMALLAFAATACYAAILYLAP